MLYLNKLMNYLQIIVFLSYTPTMFIRDKLIKQLMVRLHQDLFPLCGKWMYKEKYDMILFLSRSSYCKREIFLPCHIPNNLNISAVRGLGRFQMVDISLLCLNCS